MGFLLNPNRHYVSPGGSGIPFVGRAVNRGSVFGRSLGLTSLTGGIGTAPIAGDLVVSIFAGCSNADRNPSISTAGYTQFVDLVPSDTNRAMLTAAWKLMTSTPDTTVDFASGTDSGGASIVAALVFRGVHATTQLDTFTEGGTARNASGSNSAEPNPASGTPQTAGAKLLIIGVSAHALGAVNLSQSYLSDAYVDYYDGTTRDVSVAFGTVDWTGGAYDPAVMTLAGSTANDSWATSMIAMRPA